MISFTITSNIPNVFADEAAPASLKRAYRTALNDRSVGVAANRVVGVLSKLVSDLAFSSVLSSAVRASAESGQSVIDELLQLETQFSNQATIAHEEIRAYVAYCADLREKAAPLLGACARELSDLMDDDKRLAVLIAGSGRQRQENLDRYMAAGLSAADISLIGVKPTDEDIASWKKQLEQNGTRRAQLIKFLQSSPEYDTSVLEANMPTVAGAGV